jgi:nickel-dependent lactate racemase
MSTIDLNVGLSQWSLRVADDQLVRAKSTHPFEPAIGDVGAAVRAALDHPLRFEHPLSRALTPDDHVALVIDDKLPRLGELVGGVLQYLAVAGIGPEAVTIITAPGPQATDWIDELPDEFADVHTEVHHPDDRKLLSYLGATKRGRRIYLNRTLLDADQIIVLTGRNYDAQLGYAGCEGAIYPALADAEVRQAVAGALSMEAPGAEPETVRAEALEVAWLLSSTIFIQVVEADGDAIATIGAGLIAGSADGIRLQDERWRMTVEQPVDLVIASIGGDPRRHDFATLARAVTAASRAAEDGGCIVVLSESEAVASEAMEVLRHADDPYAALQTLNRVKPAELAAAFQWASVAERARIYLVSGMKPEIVEEMFATPICSVEEVQRLIDSADRCLILPEAHKSLVVVE